MKLKPTATLIYGFLVILGGIMGFIKASSYPSLIMGSFFGLLLVTCAIAMYKQSILAHFSATGLSGILLVFFSYRFITTLSFMPAGLMVLLSVLILSILFMKGQKVLKGQ